MGEIDVCTKEYMSNPQFFADAFNYYFFKGKQVIKPEELIVQDTAELSLPYGEEGDMVPKQKFRDVLKMWTIMTDEDASYMLLGIENQNDVHYAMPVRNMLYDALNYSAQVDEIRKKYKKSKNIKSEEFLSGFKKTDEIKPVFTLVIYWGTKAWDAPKSLFEMMHIKNEMADIVREYVNDYKIHVIVPNEIENFEWFSTELGYCLRYIQSSNEKTKLKKLLTDYKDVYSKFDKASGNLIQIVTNTKLPKSVQKEESINMCKAIEEWMEEVREEAREEERKVAKETAKEAARNCFINGANIEFVIKSITSLTEEEIVAIYEEMKK